MKTSIKVVTIFLVISILAFSISLNMYLTNNFESEFGRKPLNICEGSWMVMRFPPLQDCQEITPNENKIKQKEDLG